MVVISEMVRGEAASLFPEEKEKILKLSVAKGENNPYYYNVKVMKPKNSKITGGCS